jgi:PKD repeat protein
MKRRALAALSLLFVLFLIRCNNDNVTIPPPSLPTISSITPSKVSRAEHVIATIQGSNFIGTQQVFLGFEINIEEFSVLNANTIEVRLTVNTNAAQGKRPVQVTTAAGTATNQDLLQVIDNRAPITQFDVTPKNGAANTVYTFNATTTVDKDGTVVSYKWDFGDGKKGTGPVVSHKFGKVGTFDVTLTVVDNDDATGTASESVDVVAGVAPTAKFAINPQAGDVNTTYTFSAANSVDPDGQITQYLWNFGGNNTATGVTATFHFQNSGTFFITLTVTDNDGLQSSVQKELIVGAFDQAKATQEIQDILAEFFRRFALMPVLSAESIVVNWSDSPDCPGRAHEIKIIEAQQQIIVKETVTILGSIDVTFNSSTKAHAIVSAQFDWEETDGSTHTGTASHDFTIVFEEGHWQVCDFFIF